MLREPREGAVDGGEVLQDGAQVLRGALPPPAVSRGDEGGRCHRKGRQKTVRSRSTEYFNKRRIHSPSVVAAVIRGGSPAAAAGLRNRRILCRTRRQRVRARNRTPNISTYLHGANRPRLKVLIEDHKARQRPQSAALDVGAQSVGPALHPLKIAHEGGDVGAHTVREATPVCLQIGRTAHGLCLGSAIA